LLNIKGETIKNCEISIENCRRLCTVER